MPARTALYGLHREHGAKLVEFGGFEMPLHYRSGILQEHLHTRSACGIFDVSHMGQLSIAAGDAAALESLVPSDILDLPSGRQRYTVLSNERGGVIDDLIVARVDDELHLIVNAACRTSDLEHLRAQLGRAAVSPRDELGLLAVQGPRAAAILAGVLSETLPARFMDVRRANFLGRDIMVARSGYTGEDGFEISLPLDRAEAFAAALLAQPDTALIGLGARDSLRLEAGLCLYGHELDATTTPVEAGIGWVTGRARRPGGAREGGFPGAETILRQLQSGPSRRRVGLRPSGRAPVRDGTALLAEDNHAVGRVSSGGFGPTVGRPIAMGYVRSSHAAPGTRLLGEVRGRRLEVEVVPLPFVPLEYVR